MPSEEDKVKGADSDAFKRACSLFGIGEYLYGDELFDYEDRKPHSPDSVTSSTSQTRKQEINTTFGFDGWPKSGKQFYAWVMKVKEKYGWEKIVGDILDAFGPSSEYHYPKSFTEWTPEEVDAVARFVAHRVTKNEKYSGEFDSHLGADR